MPLNEVAKKFGMCTTALKKLCRKYGVMQWPHRKLRSLEKKIASLRAEQVPLAQTWCRVLCLLVLGMAFSAASLRVSPRVLSFKPLRRLLVFRAQRYTSDGGTHHNIDDEIRKLEQQRTPLLSPSANAPFHARFCSTSSRFSLTPRVLFLPPAPLPSCVSHPWVAPPAPCIAQVCNILISMRWRRRNVAQRGRPVTRVRLGRHRRGRGVRRGGRRRRSAQRLI